MFNKALVPGITRLIPKIDSAPQNLSEMKDTSHVTIGSLIKKFCQNVKQKRHITCNYWTTERVVFSL